MDQICIHASSSLAHQKEFAEYLKSGFKKHNQQAFISNDPCRQADIHVVLGPHFAKQNWIGHKTLLLDRGWWGDPRQDVSLSWMNDSGGHTITDGNPSDRSKPELKPWKPLGERCLLLLDYGKASSAETLKAKCADIGSITIRYHPEERKNARSLDEDLALHDCAMGEKTTALVTAAIEGLQIFCADSDNPVYPVSHQNPDDIDYPADRSQWINNLSYHQYNGQEIANGLAWEFLCQSLK